MQIPKYVIGTAALAVCVTVAAVGAQRPGGPGRGGQPPTGSTPGQDGRGRPGGPGHPCEDVLKAALNLNTDQAASFDRITQDANDQAQPLLDQVAAIHAGAHARIAEMLTPDQLKTLETFGQGPPSDTPRGRGPRGRGDGKAPPPCGRGRGR